MSNTKKIQLIKNIIAHIKEMLLELSTPSIKKHILAIKKAEV